MGRPRKDVEEIEGELNEINDTEQEAEQVEGPAPVLKLTDLERIIQAVRESGPVRKVPIAQYQQNSPFNPKNLKNRKLNRTTYQNGTRLNIETLFDEEIRLLNLLKPGRYINKLVNVRVNEGSNGAPDELYIEYANKTHDDRLKFSQHVRSFQSLLNQCVDEAAKKPLADSAS